MKACPACGSRAWKPGTGRGGLCLLRCLGCGSERLDSNRHLYRPKELYKEAYFSPWDMQPGSPAWALRSATAALRLDLLKALGAKGRLLDIGCAGGYLLVEAKARGFEPWGLEISKYAVAVAKKAMPGRVKQGILEKAGYARASFSSVTLFDVLEHHPQPGAYLKRIAGLLKPGAFLALTVPDIDSLSRRLMGASWPHYKEEHLWYPSRQGLDGLLKAAGFKVKWKGRARKCLSLGFMAPLLERYPVPLLSPAFAAFFSLLPQGLKKAPFSVSIGERLIIAEKA